MDSMTSYFIPMKLLLISAGAMSLAMALKFSLPVAVDGIPAMYSLLASWMKPPYLYIIINGIIITIAASSRFHHTQPQKETVTSISVKTPAVSSFSSHHSEIIGTLDEPALDPSHFSFEPHVTDAVIASEINDAVGEFEQVVVSGSNLDAVMEEVVESTLTKEKISDETQWETLLPVREKPLVSSRFGHRKPIRNSIEVSGVRALRVAKPKKHETLESTWKTITEGRHVPLTRHQKRSDMCEQNPVKSEALIRKEPSLGQDELNRRVEAFIKKFNEDMRMQRQESLNQFMEMINRGV